ncbi:MAG: DNA polymerase IV [bacterium]|nr:DNA polymerase IV [bacterium]
MDLPRVILHLDMDAFYAAVEVREDPRLAGKPLIIGHAGKRGVVSTCSYEARKFGVRSAMPSVTAKRLCPDATWLPGRMSLYVSVSREIRAVLGNYSPVVEPLSIDEAFIDLTGIAGSLEDGARIAQEIKDAIRRGQRLTSSVGVAPNKFLAKVASDLDKPDGLFVMPLEELDTKLWPLPVERLWGVGPKTAAKLRRGGIVKIGDIVRCDERALQLLVGEGGAAHLRALAHGRDERPVKTGRAAKSISEERTYGSDIMNPDEIDRALLARAEGVARQLRRQGLTGRTVHIKVRTGDFTTWTRSSTLAAPTDLPEPLVDEARRMFRERIDLAGCGVRLLGLGVSGLDRGGLGQGALFEDPAEQRSRKAARAADAVRDRLGEKALTRARLIRRRRDEDDDEASSLPAVD